MENTKDPKTQFLEAFAKAQLAFKPVEKTAKNPFFKSNYAPYEEAWASVGKPLNENGIVVIHESHFVNDKFMLTTKLIHFAGHEISSVQPIVPEKLDNMQGRGSALTYAKRYNLVLLTAVPIIAEDDDGNAACETGKIDKEQEKTLKELLQKTGDIENFLAKLGVSRIEDITKEQFPYCINIINKKIASIVKKEA